MSNYDRRILSYKERPNGMILKMSPDDIKKIENAKQLEVEQLRLAQEAMEKVKKQQEFLNSELERLRQKELQERRLKKLKKERMIKRITKQKAKKKLPVIVMSESYTTKATKQEKNYITNHFLGEKMTNKELAKILGVSVTNISKNLEMFKRGTLGGSPLYIEKKVLDGIILSKKNGESMTFKTAEEAGQSIGCTRSYIYQVCDKKLKVHGYSGEKIYRIQE